MRSFAFSPGHGRSLCWGCIRGLVHVGVHSVAALPALRGAAFLPSLASLGVFATQSAGALWCPGGLTSSGGGDQPPPFMPPSIIFSMRCMSESIIIDAMDPMWLRIRIMCPII